MLKPDQLTSFLIEQLNKIHCSLSHVIERLSEIMDHADFCDLQVKLESTQSIAEINIAKGNDLYAYLNEDRSFNGCEILTVYLEEAFFNLQVNSSNPELRELLLSDYLKRVKNVCETASKLLRSATRQSQNERLHHLIFNTSSADFVGDAFDLN